MATSKEQKSMKMVAEMVLRVQGIDYEEWLYEQHQAVITKNTETIRQVTETALTKPLTSHNHVINSEEGEIR